MIIEESTGKEVMLIRGYTLSNSKGEVIAEVKDHLQYVDGTQLDKQPPDVRLIEQWDITQVYWGP